ncbi:hypothetical protein FHR83_002499 [Actinoplanes campanulatus]|uniref:Uncharacterized protein n=1 Tax=Actinoplanes campanulatus TaxID=113559 RepID=A0A7W5AF10_9ACTN|nr:hypothetical protein [Actinoplanes campanulatus]MBB3094836.1 hypothetical protein [Actinoplanes campanulatus]
MSYPVGCCGRAGAQARATTDDLVGLLTTAVQPFETEARRRLASFTR